LTKFNNDPSRKIGLLMLTLGWILIIVLVWILYSKVIFAPKASEIRIVDELTQIKLYPDRDGHYRILGNINQTKVNFLIDTGATNVAIPLALAKKLKLQNLGSTSVITASGKSSAYITKIDELIIGGIAIYNVNALVVYDMHGSIALLGMNVLKRFSIEQNKDYMILKATQKKGH